MHPDEQPEQPEHHVHLWALDVAVADLRDRLDALENAVVDADDIDDDIDAKDIDLDAVDEAGALLDELEDALEGQQVRVALLGDTNAGKSTLVNAVLGQRLLPSSSSGPGTAVVSTLRHRPGPTITVEILFATGANLRRACQELLDQLAALRDQPDDIDIDLDILDLVDASRRRLGRVFGATLRDYLATGRVSVLHEVPEAAAIVAEGRRVVDSTSADDVHRTLLAHADASAAIGYLVERVDIAGDFPALRTGVTLLDLPGLNDPDARRTAAARQAIADADVVWVVYPLDTGLGTSTIRAVQSTLTAHHLLLDRRATRLRFVCTKNEGVADDTAHRLGLLPETSDTERRAVRDAATLEELTGKVDLLVRPLGRRLGDLAVEATRIVREAPVHLVSAHDSLRHDADAGISPLAEELVAIGTQLVPADALQALGDAVDRVAAIVSAIERGDTIETTAHDTADAIEPGALAQLRSFAADLRGLTAAFVDQTSAAAHHSFADDARLRSSWESLSPIVLHSIALRRGFFTGSGGAHYDCNADIGQSFFVMAQHAWVQYFRVDLPAIMTPMLEELTSLTGARPVMLYREAQRFAREVEPDLLAAIVETVRERLVPHYDRLVNGVELPSGHALVDGLVGAIDTERDMLRSAVVECVRTWLAGVVDDLIAAAYADASRFASRST
ncbi:MAG: hypothetical protein F2812_02770 [Actinobacteria bacterium]|uniref:Unannotated protein n=1 Tax=freshwater metagenome TaxID=449393 RepID=A0A6J7FNW5_9ZZZZ|nr:hypothetical protein [Actinomycetota bacterium]